jgi:hypothetical protein
MITIFCDFCQFSAKKLAVFSKTNVMIKILHNFFAIFFGENILKSVPGRRSHPGPPEAGAAAGRQGSQGSVDPERGVALRHPDARHPGVQHHQVLRHRTRILRRSARQLIFLFLYKKLSPYTLTGFDLATYKLQMAVF